MGCGYTHNDMPTTLKKISVLVSDAEHAILEAGRKSERRTLGQQLAFLAFKAIAEQKNRVAPGSGAARRRKSSKKAA